MTKNEYLDAYLTGFAHRDTDRLMSSLADSYVLDDPANGRIPKADMPTFISTFIDAVKEMRAGDDSSPILDIDEKVVRDEGDIMSAMIWWKIPGTPMEGGGWIKVGDDGVQSERLTYYTKPAD